MESKLGLDFKKVDQTHPRAHARNHEHGVAYRIFK